MTTDNALQLAEQLNILAGERSELIDEHARRQANGGCLREIDSAFAEHCEKWHPAMRSLADTPADSVEGVIAKLRVVAMSVVNGRETEYDEDILLLAIADLERLSNAAS